MLWRDVGFFGRDVVNTTTEEPSSSSSSVDVPLVAGGWSFTAVVSTTDASLTLRDFATRPAIVDERLRLAIAVSCSRDRAFVVTSGGWVLAAYADGASGTKWTKLEGVENITSACAASHCHDAVVIVDASGRAVEVRGLDDASGPSTREASLALGGDARVRSVALGAKHGVFVDVNGGCWTFGWNAYGTCGLGFASAEDIETPTRVESFARANVRAVSASCGDAFTVFVAASGDAYACGYNGDGQLGTEDCPVGEATAIPVLVDLERVVVARCGARHCAAVADRRLFLWGANDLGQMGVGPDVMSHRVRPRACAVDVVAVAVGVHHVSLLRSADAATGAEYVSAHV